MALGEYLPLRPRGLITSVSIPMQAKFAFERASRTPQTALSSLPRRHAGPRAARGWRSAALEASPSLAMDGTEAEGLETAARNACHESGDDFASAEYRMEVAAALAARCLGRLQT